MKFRTTLHPDHLSAALMQEVKILQHNLKASLINEEDDTPRKVIQGVIDDYYRVEVELTGNTEESLINSITWVNQPREGDEWLSVDGKCYLYETAQRFLKCAHLISR